MNDLGGSLMTDDSRYLGTREAAEWLDVGESTVKRWVDQGVLPAERTLGRHRKIRLGDLRRVARDRNLPLARLGRTPGPPDLPVLAEQLHSALVQGDHEGAHSALRQGHEGGLCIAELGDRLISPVMGRIGHEWFTSELDVYQEHRATQACLFALLALRLRLPRPLPGNPLAIGGGPEGDHYLLPNLLVEMTLIEDGWSAENIGPNTPMPSLCRAVRERRPRLVWMSCSHLTAPEEFLTGLRFLHEEVGRVGASVAVGGGALTEGIRPRLGDAHFCGSLAELSTFARGLR